MQVVIEAGFGHLFGANAEPGALIFFRRAGAMKFERTLHEAFRILKPQGRIAFTDWVAHRPLSEADRKLMWQDMAVTDLYSLQAYGELIRAAGFTVCSYGGLGCHSQAAARHVYEASRGGARSQHACRS